MQAFENDKLKMINEKLQNDKYFEKCQQPIKLRFGTDILQILEEQSAGFHVLVSCLKPSMDLLFLISEYICSKIYGRKYADSARA